MCFGCRSRPEVRLGFTLALQGAAGKLALEGATWLAAPDERNMSTGHMEQTDLLSLCFVESVNRLRCRLNHDLALLLGKVGLGLGGEPHIALLARAKDKPPA